MREQLTLRKLIERLKSRDGEDGFEKALDLPLYVGVFDRARNYQETRIPDDWPHTRVAMPKTEFCVAYEGMLRFDVHLDGFMRKKKAGQ